MLPNVKLWLCFRLLDDCAAVHNKFHMGKGGERFVDGILDRNDIGLLARLNGAFAWCLAAYSSAIQEPN